MIGISAALSSLSDKYSSCSSKIVLSDECMSRINAVVDKQNVRIWGTQRLLKHYLMVLNSHGIRAWCAIANEQAIGPNFLKQ